MKERIKSLVSIFRNLEPRVRNTVLIFLVFVAAAAIIFIFSGGDKRELRESLPADSLAFFEMRNAGSILRSMAKNAADDRVRDFSMFDDIDIAVAVSGFETSEQELSGETSVLNLRFKFAAVAETNGWGWQTRQFVDGALSELVAKEFGKGVERTSKTTGYGSLTVWSAADGRKTYAFTEGSRIYFGNDEPFLGRCVASARGEIKSIIEDEELEALYRRNSGAVVFGYMPKRAITKFASIAGVSAAVSGSEDSGVRGFISRVVPQLIDNSVESVLWSARQNSLGIEDEITLRTNREVSEIFGETMQTGDGDYRDLFRFVPENTASLTKYNLRNPRIAYRSLILVAGRNVDPVSANLLGTISEALLGSYGIEDPEKFLDSIKGEIVTLELDDSERSAAALSTVKHKDSLIESLVAEIRAAGNLGSPPDGGFQSFGEEFAAAIVDGFVITGDRKAVEECLKTKGNAVALLTGKRFESLGKSGAPAVSVAEERDDYGFLYESGSKGGSLKNNIYFSETSFGKGGIIRRYESKFGLIGTLLSNITEG